MEFKNEMRVKSIYLGEKKRVLWRGKEIFTGIFKYLVNEYLDLGFEDVKYDHVIDRRYQGGKIRLVICMLQ